jgi:hypothetical protein
MMGGVAESFIVGDGADDVLEYKRGKIEIWKFV